jgi:DnaJ-class molecular chaperone
MTAFKEIDKARRLLGLGEKATLKEIKQAYRKMAFRSHPDRKGQAGNEKDDMMKQLNWAYKLLLDYVANYSYSFTEEDVAKYYPYEEYLRRFRNGWFDGI